MDNYCIITPDRGDRPELLSFCKYQVDVKDHFIIDYKPSSLEVDIIPRVKAGIEQAKAKGYDFAFIVESDDYYSPEYFSLLTHNLDNYDFVGFSDTVYYNLKNRTYQTFDHSEDRRSSLFCTGFRISAMDKFDWPKDKYKWLDIRLWEYANLSNKRIKLLRDNPNLGIKGHNQGIIAGKGHSMFLKNMDPSLDYLKSRVDENAFEFYCEIMKKL
jgi:hypothetical protein